MPVAVLERTAACDITAADRDSRHPGVGVKVQPPPAAPGDTDLVARLRAGDAAAFAHIVRAWSPAMIHVARYFVGSHASAEEAVQETWLAVIRGIDGFEGRSSLRTWVFHVLSNIARRQGVKESRTVLSSPVDGEDAGPTVDPARFRPPR